MDVQGVNFKVLSSLKYRCCAKNKEEHFVLVCVHVYVPGRMQRPEENISVVLALSLPPPPPYLFERVSLTELGTSQQVPVTAPQSTGLAGVFMWSYLTNHLLSSNNV